MAEAAKYFFDRDFNAPAPETESAEVLVERRLRREFEQELANAREAEYKRGRKEGEREARQSLEAKTGEAADALVDKAEKILNRLEQDCAEIRGEAVAVALAAAERLAGELVRREPANLLESLFTRCLDYLDEVPHITVRVNETVADTLREKVEAAAARRGFTGRIVVQEDPETQKGDCLIEWNDGGIARDHESLRRHVAEIVERHLLARGDAAAAETDSDGGQPEESGHLPPPAADDSAGADGSGDPHRATHANGSGENQ